LVHVHIDLDPKTHASILYLAKREKKKLPEKIREILEKYLENNKGDFK